MKPGTKKGRRFVKRLLALGSVSALAMLAGTSMSSHAASKSEVEAQRLLKAAELRFGMTAAQAAGFFDTANLPRAQVELLKANLQELRALTPDQINGLLGYFDAAQGETGGTGQTVARWIQMAPGSSTNALVSGNYGDQPTSVFPTILARAIVSGGACPVVHLDGGLTWPLRVRFTGSSLTNVPGTAGATNAKAGYPQYFVQNTAPQNFPNGTPMATTSWTECESALPFGYHTATIDGVDLALPKAKPTRFLVLADTGCRMAGALAANGANQQNCSDPTTFPLAYLANLEATFKPDLVVHVGDYFYRDTNCNNTFPGCADPTSANYEMYGDTFDSWNADLLFPGQVAARRRPLDHDARQPRELRPRRARLVCAARPAPLRFLESVVRPVLAGGAVRHGRELHRGLRADLCGGHAGRELPGPRQQPRQRHCSRDRAGAELRRRPHQRARRRRQKVDQRLHHPQARVRPGLRRAIHQRAGDRQRRRRHAAGRGHGGHLRQQRLRARRAEEYRPVPVGSISTRSSM